MITRIAVAFVLGDLAWHVWKLVRADQEMRFRNNFSERWQARRFAWGGWKWTTYSANWTAAPSPTNIVITYPGVQYPPLGGGAGGGGGSSNGGKNGS